MRHVGFRKLSDIAPFFPRRDAPAGARYRAGQGDGDGGRPAARANFAQDTRFMRKVLLAGVAALAALAAVPERSHAWGKDPYNGHGYDWFNGMAFRKMLWIHSNGPLFNYGPYYLPGHVTMHIPQPYHGPYTPADPNLWNNGFGVYGSVVPAPSAGSVTQQTASHGPPHAKLPAGPPRAPDAAAAPGGANGLFACQ